MNEESQNGTEKQISAGGLLLRVVGISLAILASAAIVIALVFFVGTMLMLKGGRLAH